MGAPHTHALLPPRVPDIVRCFFSETLQVCFRSRVRGGTVHARDQPHAEVCVLGRVQGGTAAVVALGRRGDTSADRWFLGTEEIQCGDRFLEQLPPAGVSVQCLRLPARGLVPAPPGIV